MKNFGAHLGTIDATRDDVDCVIEGRNPVFLHLQGVADGQSTSEFGHSTGATCGVLGRL